MLDECYDMELYDFVKADLSDPVRLPKLPTHQDCHAARAEGPKIVTPNDMGRFQKPHIAVMGPIVWLQQAFAPRCSDLMHCKYIIPRLSQMRSISILVPQLVMSDVVSPSCTRFRGAPFRVGLLVPAGTEEADGGHHCRGVYHRRPRVC